jgi:hypothetical protein
VEHARGLLRLDEDTVVAEFRVAESPQAGETAVIEIVLFVRRESCTQLLLMIESAALREHGEYGMVSGRHSFPHDARGRASKSPVGCEWCGKLAESYMGTQEKLRALSVSGSSSGSNTVMLE